MSSNAAAILSSLTFFLGVEPPLDFFHDKADSVEDDFEAEDVEAWAHEPVLVVAGGGGDEAGMDVLMSGDDSTRFSPTTFGGTGAAAAGPTALDTGRHFASCSAVL